MLSNRPTSKKNMHTAFWFGYELNDFLFVNLNIRSISGLIFLCLALIGLTVAFEGLKVLLAEVKIKSVLNHSQSRPRLLNIHDSTTLLNDIFPDVKRKQMLYNLLEISLYITQVILGYILMLSVMTYNAFLSLAILLGVAMGYSIFGKILMERRIRNTQLTMPCQQCLQSEGKIDVEVATDDVSSSECCSRTLPA